MCPATRLVKNTGGESKMSRSSNDGTSAFALRANDLRNTRARSLDAVIVPMRSAGNLERRLP